MAAMAWKYCRKKRAASRTVEVFNRFDRAHVLHPRPDPEQSEFPRSVRSSIVRVESGLQDAGVDYVVEEAGR